MKYRKAPMFPREGAAAGREFPTMRSSRFNCERAGAHAKNESASAALRKRITGKGKMERVTGVEPASPAWEAGA